MSSEDKNVELLQATLVICVAGLWGVVSTLLVH
jgi:hypothetical protein